MNDIIKKLTGKNPKDFEPAAAHIINEADSEAFSALVEKCDFLFDFIKENVKKRLAKYINENNFKNLLKFLPIYSYDFEDLIISNLVKYSNEDLTDEMLNIFENGTKEEKAYCAKYFSRINDSLSIELLKKYTKDEYEPLAYNCAQALGAFKDKESYENAIKELQCDDEFKKLSAVKFLTAYNDKKAIPEIFRAMKSSSMAENIACEIFYMSDVFELLEQHFEKTLLAINHVINALGEVAPLNIIFNIQLYELIEIFFEKDFSKTALTLINIKQKISQLTENDEYLFDEDKSVKEEVLAIKELLNSKDENFWNCQYALMKEELFEDSQFVYFALDLTNNYSTEIKTLVQNSSNETLILKTIEVLKSLNKLNEVDKDSILKKIHNENIKAIITSYFC